jgi:hypothetical protein
VHTTIEKNGSQLIKVWLEPKEITSLKGTKIVQVA